MHSFHLAIEMGNAEMSEPEHVALALRNVAERLGAGYVDGPIRDVNGNTVGEFKLADGPIGHAAWHGHDDETAGTDSHNVRVNVLEQIIDQAEKVLTFPAGDRRIIDTAGQIVRLARAEHARSTT